MAPHHASALVPSPRHLASHSEVEPAREPPSGSSANWRRSAMCSAPNSCSASHACCAACCAAFRTAGVAPHTNDCAAAGHLA
eukprot:4279718-Prymnesium_polylepis.1